MFSREDGSRYKASGRVSLKQLADSDDATRRPPGLKGLVLSSLTLLLVGSASSFPRIHAAGIHCNSGSSSSIFSAGALLTVRSRGRDTPAERCQLGVPRKHFAKDSAAP